MKERRISEGYWRIERGNTIIDIYPTINDIHPKIPVRIRYEGIFYPLSISTSVLAVIKAFENCYSEEQILETLINYIENKVI